MAPGNFMKVLMFLSACSIPLVIFVIVGYGLLMGKNVYEIFVKGAAEGLKTVAAILPTLVGLMAAVGILRASGVLDLLSDICAPPSIFPEICRKPPGSGRRPRRSPLLFYSSFLPPYFIIFSSSHLYCFHSHPVNGMRRVSAYFLHYTSFFDV